MSKLVPLIKNGNTELRHLVDYMEELLSTFDVNGDGVVSRMEFTTALNDHPTLQEAFVDSISVSVSTGSLV